jgi:hypothetical protein
MAEETLSPEALARYAAGPDQLEAEIGGLSESDLDLSLAPGEWTIRQIVHHLADGDDMWSLCAKMGLGAPGCTFDTHWYPGNEPWADKMEYTAGALEPSMTLFRANHFHIAQLLKRIPDGWQREVVLKAPWLEGERRVKVEAVIDLLTKHAVEHVEEIHKVREQHGL